MWYEENVKEINNKSHLLIMKLFFLLFVATFAWIYVAHSALSA